MNSENYRPALSSERASHYNRKKNGLKEYPWKQEKMCYRITDGGLTPGESGRLTVGCNVTSASVVGWVS
jgi:hypothetical protein